MKKVAQIMALAVLCLLSAILGIFLYLKTPLSNLWQFPEWVRISSKASLVQIGSNDSFPATQDGIQAAKLVLNFLESKNPEAAKAALQIYSRIIPKENYGGEYTALEWFCQYLLTSENEKKKFVSDKFVASFYDFFAANSFANLKEYIKRKYNLAKFADSEPEAGQNRKAFLEDFILFNNPKREEWEKTSKIVSSLNLKPGQSVADIGSGPGYYTFKFSEIVGEKGHVYAIDTVQDHLNYVKRTAEKYGFRNITTVNNSPGTTIKLAANQVDVAFMCSLYHNIYAISREDERNTFLESILSALKKDGTLIVVDNALVKKNELPYHGPYIARELIIGQFQYQGLRLVAQYAFTPQRYALIFKKD